MGQGPFKVISILNARGRKKGEKLSMPGGKLEPLPPRLEFSTTKSGARLHKLPETAKRRGLSCRRGSGGMG